MTEFNGIRVLAWGDSVIVSSEEEAEAFLNDHPMLRDLP